MKKRIGKVVAALGMINLLCIGVIFAQNQRNQYSSMEPAKLEAFCKDIQPQWQRWWQIRNELRELWSKKPPDWDAIEKKEQELVKTRLEIQKKAQEKGLPYGPRGGLRLKRICGW